MENIKTPPRVILNRHFEDIKNRLDEGFGLKSICDELRLKYNYEFSDTGLYLALKKKTKEGKK